MSKNFEPYIAWDKVTPEMASKMHEKILEYRAATTEFERTGSPEDCGNLLRLQFEMSNLAAVYHERLYIQPVMVHIAGEKVHEQSLDDPDSDDEMDQPHDHVVQRCSRCGSILQMWCEKILVLTPEGPTQIPVDEVTWWEPGTIIAKADDDDSLTMYEIEEGTELQPHQKPCLDLSSLKSHED